MRSLVLKENELLDKWERIRNYSEFIRDGVVDEKAYLSKRPRLVFILKEANDFGNGGDLRRLLVQQVKGSTWRNVARWTIGIKALPEIHIPWEKVESISKGEMLTALKTIAVVNLKKQSGGARASRSAILDAARSDRDLLIEQINIYKPDIIVCCGVDDIVREVSLVSSNWEHPKGHDRYLVTDKGTIWVEAYHPNAHEEVYPEVVFRSLT